MQRDPENCNPRMRGSNVDSFIRSSKNSRDRTLDALQAVGKSRTNVCTKYLDERCTPSEHVVILDKLAELREVPAVPLADSHGECVQVFVKLVQQADALNNHVVRSRRIHLHLLDIRQGDHRLQSKIHLRVSQMGTGIRHARRRTVKCFVVPSEPDRSELLRSK